MLITDDYSYTAFEHDWAVFNGIAERFNKALDAGGCHAELISINSWYRAWQQYIFNHWYCEE